MDGKDQKTVSNPKLAQKNHSLVRCTYHKQWYISDQNQLRYHKATMDPHSSQLNHHFGSK